MYWIPRDGRGSRSALPLAAPRTADVRDGRVANHARGEEPVSEGIEESQIATGNPRPGIENPVPEPTRRHGIRRSIGCGAIHRHAAGALQTGRRGVFGPYVAPGVEVVR